MKKHILGLTALIITAILTFTGCLAKDVADMAGDRIESLKSSKSEDKSESEEHIIPGYYARDLLAEIIECLNSGDKERLREFFCIRVLHHLQIDADIDGVFDFIDGKIIACSEVHYTGGSDWDYYEIRCTSYSASTYLITDKGAEYEICIAGKLYDVEDERNEGLGLIELVNKNHAFPEEGNSGLWEEHWRDYKEYIYILN